MGKRFGEREADFQHTRSREAALREIGAEGVGSVGIRCQVRGVR